MSLDCLQGEARTKTAEKLRHRHFGQIVHRSTDHHYDLQSVYAITFRPGDRSGSFLGKRFRLAGVAPLIALSYENTDDHGRKRMPFRSYKMDFQLDGTGSYGVHGGDCFYFDGANSLRTGARGRQLDPLRNPTLAELLLRMDGACTKRLGKLNLPYIPKFPKIVLGFAPNQLPQFEDSPALRRLAARQIGVRVDRLGCNGDLLLERLLHDVWERQFTLPHDLGNDTGMALLDAELCSQVRSSLRVFEDFSELVGDYTWNPAREVTPFQSPNPAPAVLTEFGVDTEKDFCQQIPGQVVDAMVARMRELLGENSGQFTDEEIMDGLVSPSDPVSAWTAALPRLRAKLTPAVAEATTDEDLLKAARNPAEPLFASGLCKIQVLRRRALGQAWDLFFSSEDLGRRLFADLKAKEARAATVSPMADDAPSAASA